MQTSQPPASGGSGSSRANEDLHPLLTSAARRVTSFARNQKLFRRVSRVLVAVSGGPDSLALLLLLREVAPEFGFEIEACHFDHQLRPDSDADLERVRAMCAGLGVECVTGEGDVRGVATQQKASLEDTARRMRYQFLAFVAEKENCDCVATGHTADDQAETILMRILRGSGVRGIRGMLPRSGVPGADARGLVRPILELSRAETAAICSEAGIEPITDPSNADLTILRNRLRLETIPVLRAINPSVGDALRRLGASAREVFEGVERESFLVQPVARLPIGVVFELGPFAALQDEARTLVIEREAAFYNLEPEVNRTRVENLAQVLRQGRGEVRFGDTVVEASSGKVRVGPALEPVEPFEGRILDVPGSTVAGSWRVDVSTQALPPAAGAMAGALDSDAVQGALRVRAVVPGDRMVFRGMERSIADVFTASKTPRWERMGVVAIADAARVQLLFTAAGVLGDSADAPDPWFVRVQQAPGR